MTRLRLKVDLLHDRRNQGADVERIEYLIEEMITKAIEDVRISVGLKAGAVFVLFEPDVKLSNQVGGYTPDRVAQLVVDWLESERYADDVRIEHWIVEPYEGGSA